MATYHGPPWRDPPTVYLGRIVARYPQINLDWLVTDVGEPTRAAARQVQENLLTVRFVHEPPDEDQAVQGAFESQLPGLRPWGSALKALWDLWRTVADSPVQPRGNMVEAIAGATPAGTHETGRPRFDVTKSYRKFEVELAKRIARGVRSSLRPLGVDWTQLQDATHREMYVVLHCQAQQAAWLAATTETKPLGEFQASLKRETDAAREKGTDEMFDKVRRRLVEATEGKNAVDTSTARKEKANDGE